MTYPMIAVMAVAFAVVMAFAVAVPVAVLMTPPVLVPSAVGKRRGGQQHGDDEYGCEDRCE
jgi:hypothetical protein